MQFFSVKLKCSLMIGIVEYEPCGNAAACACRYLNILRNALFRPFGGHHDLLCHAVLVFYTVDPDQALVDALLCEHAVLDCFQDTVICFFKLLG